MSHIIWRDMCSWKGQLERTRSLKVLSWIVWSWKEPSEVEKNRLKSESFFWSWKVWMKMKSCDWNWKVNHTFQIRVRETYKLGTISAKPLNFIKQNFYHPKKLPNLTWNLWRTFQLQSKLSKFKSSFPTSIGSFQLRSVLSNFARFFSTSLGSF